jgi:hypothetical protein
MDGPTDAWMTPHGGRDAEAGGVSQAQVTAMHDASMYTDGDGVRPDGTH